MDAGIEYESKKRLGTREKLTLEFLMENAVTRIQAVFGGMGWSRDAISPKIFCGLGCQRAELASLRLYTGPMFMLYNTMLRSMSSDGIVPWGPMQGQDVRGRFVTTTHAINSGIIKLSRMQPTCSVFRCGAAPSFHSSLPHRLKLSP
eukprot:SAG11_NODE_3278_length_2557_cov_2.015813_2_plen_147_part_00